MVFRKEGLIDVTGPTFIPTSVLVLATKWCFFMLTLPPLAICELTAV